MRSARRRISFVSTRVAGVFRTSVEDNVAVATDMEVRPRGLGWAGRPSGDVPGSGEPHAERAALAVARWLAR